MFQPPVNEDGSVAPSPSLEFTKVEDISCRLVSLTCLTNIIEEETKDDSTVSKIVLIKFLFLTAVIILALLCMSGNFKSLSNDYFLALDDEYDLTTYFDRK